MPYTISKHKPLKKSLSAEGGGVKGAAYGGCALALEQLGILVNIEEVSGSSAGAIFALLLGVGYSANEIHDILINLDFTQFQDHGKFSFYERLKIFGLIRGIKGLFSKRHGFYEGKVFLNWVKEKIRIKLAAKISDAEISEDELNEIFGNDYTQYMLEDITFKQFSAIRTLYRAHKPGNNSLRDMIFTGTDVNNSRTVLFDEINKPDVSIALATRISMSFPFAFKSIHLDGVDYIDGGTLNNDPRGVFDKQKYVAPGYRLSRSGINHSALGLRIDSKQEIEGLAKSDDYAALIGADENVALAHPHSDIRIDDLGISTLDFDISDKDKNALIKSGFDAVQNWYQQYYLGVIFREYTYNNLNDMYNAIDADMAPGLNKADLFIYLTNLESMPLAEIERLKKNPVLVQKIKEIIEYTQQAVSNYLLHLKAQKLNDDIIFEIEVQTQKLRLQELALSYKLLICSATHTADISAVAAEKQKLQQLKALCNNRS